MQELVEYIVNSLVDNPENVEVEIDNSTIYIKATKDEIGKIIGKQGKIAKAIRTTVKAASIKNNTRWSVEIIEK